MKILENYSDSLIFQTNLKWAFYLRYHLSRWRRVGVGNEPYLIIISTSFKLRLIQLLS